MNKRNAISDEMPDFFTQSKHILLTATQSGNYFVRGERPIKQPKHYFAKTTNKPLHFGISIDSPFDSKTTHINPLTKSLFPNEPRSQFYLS